MENLITTSKQIQKIYNEIAEDYDDLLVLDKLLYDQIHPILLNNTANLKRGLVIDVGCGTGAQSVLLAQLGFHVVGVDIAQELLKIYHKKLTSFQNTFSSVAQASGTHLPFPAKTFDVAVCFYNVLNHIPDYELALKEMARVLKKNGFLFLEVGKIFLVNTFYEILDSLIGGHLNYCETKENILRHILRRDRNSIVTWNIGSTIIINWQFSHNDIEKCFKKIGYMIERKFGVDIFVALIPWAFRITKLKPIYLMTRLLGKIDRKISGKKPFNSFGLRTVYILKKT